jgi:hypothetical protein
MASLAIHRARAVVSAALDGLVVGGAEAALDQPPRTWARHRIYLALGAAVSTETVLRELPALHRVLRGLPAIPADPRDEAARLHQGLVTTGWGLAITLADGPLARVLRRHGVQRPHLLLGVVVGLATATSTLPVWWRRAGLQATEDQAAAELDAEFEQLLGPTAG